MTMHMVKKVNSLARKCAVVVILAVPLVGIALAQDREARSGMSVPNIASRIWLNADLIAVGEFGMPAELGDDPLSLLRSRELDIEFAVQTVYKGAVAPGAVVHIRLRSDMLAYPGEDISRYEKRRRVFEETGESLRRAAEDMEVLRQTLEGAVARGDMTRAERDEQIRMQNVRDRQLLDDGAELMRMQRVLFISHGTTFYDIGGALQPGTPYLIALLSIGGNPVHYALGELGTGVYWGEVAEDVLAEIHRRWSPDSGSGDR